MSSIQEPPLPQMMKQLHNSQDHQGKLPLQTSVSSPVNVFLYSPTVVIDVSGALESLSSATATGVIGCWAYVFSNSFKTGDSFFFLPLRFIAKVFLTKQFINVTELPFLPFLKSVTSAQNIHFKTSVTCPCPYFCHYKQSWRTKIHALHFKQNVPHGQITQHNHILPSRNKDGP